ncbi:MAG: Rid family hydrolase [Pseudomonadota bacterium]
MPRTPIIPESLKDTYDRLHFAPATRAGDMVYLSGVIAALKDGQSGTDEEYAAATDEAFAEIEMVLKEAGGSMADIVDITSYHVDANKHLAALAQVKDKWIVAPYPSWTVIGTTGLFNPLGFVEIKATAYIPQ